MVPPPLCDASCSLIAPRAVSPLLQVFVTVGKGPGKGMAWGCDLSYDYVKINAEYTT